LTNDWMIAFAPANNPKVAVAVVVPNQPGSDTGAEVSGPPMKTILGDALARDAVTPVAPEAHIEGGGAGDMVAVPTADHPEQSTPIEER
jgi:hypothetical protein